MPVISTFYGITIMMFYAEHGVPHFHVRYAEYQLVVGISPIVVLAGKAPLRVVSLVTEWAGLHQRELLDNWERCRGGQTPSRVAPLE